MKPDIKEILHSYPYELGVRGIDFTSVTEKLSDDEGDNDYTGSAKSGSGAPIQVKLSKTLLEVTDRSDPLVGMNVKAREVGVTADLNTRRRDPFLGETGVHDDMRASRFLDLGLRYLDAQGNDVGTFNAEWLVSTTNYNMYRVGVDTGKERKDAASNTWTGRVLGRLGYSPVNVEHDDSQGLPRILTRFVRK